MATETSAPPAADGADQEQPWYSLAAADVAARLGVEPDAGLEPAMVDDQLARYGRNELPTEPPPSAWQVARGQLANPMNIMLILVGLASFGIGQIATGIVVAGLVTFNVVMGSRQELKALASVEALAELQVPHARVRRGGHVE